MGEEKTKPCPACKKPLDLPTEFFNAIERIREQVDSFDEVKKMDAQLDVDRLTTENTRLAERVAKLESGLREIIEGCDSAIEIKDRGDWYIYLASNIGDTAAKALNGGE